jgi:hypothetical protein
MGKGGYLGGSSVVGSSVGFVRGGSATSQKAPSVRIGARKKKKPLTLKEKRLAPIDMKALPDVEDVKKAAKRVAAVQADIATAKQRLETLEQQLGVTFDQFELALKTASKPQATVRASKASNRGKSK